LKLGREQLHLLNDLASFYPVRLAQFLTGGNIQATTVSTILKNSFESWQFPSYSR
jgi:hypothetical protein